MATVLLTGCGGGSLGSAAPTANGLAIGNEMASKVAGHKTTSAHMVASKKNVTAYTVGPQDVLEIAVFKVPEFSKTVQVSNVGTINYPLLGEVAATGLTARQIERSLTKKLGAKYLQKPQVTVFIKEYNSQKVTIEGAVKRPGVYPVRGGMTLLQTIATAQGFTDASDNVVVVFRNVNGKRKAAKHDVSAIRSGTKNDPALQSGDVVVVGTSAIKKGWNALMNGLPLAKLLVLL